jgi:hypothetical protein
MTKGKTCFKTTAEGTLPGGVKLLANSEYRLAPAPAREPPAQGFLDKDALIAWLDHCVLGDLRTLETGISTYLAHESTSANDRLGGANYLLAAGCCLALE